MQHEVFAFPTSPNRERSLRLPLVLAALTVICLPLVTAGRALGNWHGTIHGSSHLLPGLLVIGLTLWLYFVAARRGALLRRDESGFRLEPADVFLLLAFPIYLGFAGSGLADQTGDNISSRILPYQIVANGTLDLSTSPHMPELEHPHYSTIDVDGRMFSSWPLGTPILALPYAALTYLLNGGEVTREQIYFWSAHFAALATAASACLLFLGVRRRYGEFSAVATTLVFAFATTAMSSISQGMQNFTGEMLCVTAALALLIPESRKRWQAALAGVALGFAFTCRPSALVLIAGITLIVFVRNRRAAWPLALAAAATILTAAALQFAVFGHVLGAYGLMASRSGVWGANVWSGLAGNLVSPGRGVLLYFPYLLVLGLTARCLWKECRPDAWWTGSLLLIAANYLVISLYSRWWGGNSVGPRLMGESAPFLALITIPWWANWRALGTKRLAIISALGLAAVIHVIIGHDVRVRHWYQRVAEPAGLTGVQRANQEPLWWWADSQLAAAFRPLPPCGYLRGPSWTEAPAHMLRVDLADAANARYDVHAFRPQAPESKVRFARLQPERMNVARALFHFADTEKPNSITTYRRPAPPALPVADSPVRRLHAVMTAGGSEQITGTPVIAYWDITYADGQHEQLPIRLNVHVFRFKAAERSRVVPGHRVYAGNPARNDVLVRSTWKPSRPLVAIRQLRLRCAPEFKDRDVGVCLLALTLEPPRGES